MKKVEVNQEKQSYVDFSKNKINQRVKLDLDARSVIRGVVKQYYYLWIRRKH
jgi:hypothetical protein